MKLHLPQLLKIPFSETPRTPMGLACHIAKYSVSKKYNRRGLAKEIRKGRWSMYGMSQFLVIDSYGSAYKELPTMIQPMRVNGRYMLYTKPVV